MKKGNFLAGLIWGMLGSIWTALIFVGGLIAGAAVTKPRSFNPPSERKPDPLHYRDIRRDPYRYRSFNPLWEEFVNREWYGDEDEDEENYDDE